MKLTCVAILLSIGCSRAPRPSAPGPKPPAAYDAAELEILVDALREQVGVRVRSVGPEGTRARVVIEVESATSRDLELDPGRIELDLLTRDDVAFHTISPDQTGVRPIAPFGRSRLDLTFELPPGVVPENVDAIRLRWSLGRGEARIDRTTAFLVDPVTARAYHTPFYDAIDDRANRRSYSHVEAPFRSFVHQPLPYRSRVTMGRGPSPSVAAGRRLRALPRAPTRAFVSAAEPRSPERACEGIDYAQRRQCPLESVRHRIYRIEQLRDGVVVRLSAEPPRPAPEAGSVQDLGRWLECNRAMVAAGRMPPCSIDLDELDFVVEGAGGEVMVRLSAPGWPDVLKQRAVELLRR
ncbi:MAG: hypothetical protein HYY06_31575 [Deltaproteobacteria bacterium]|nr:hypothetical protein [Deltaproteobacteria bacterium]